MSGVRSSSAAATPLALSHLAQRDTQVTTVPFGAHPALRARNAPEILKGAHDELMGVARCAAHPHLDERALPTSDSADTAVGQPDALEGSWPAAGLAGTLWHELLEGIET